MRSTAHPDLATMARSIRQSENKRIFLPTRTRGVTMLAVLFAGAIASLLASLFVGSVALSPADVLGAVDGHAGALAHTLVLDIRLPRTLAAFATGGLLGLAGALMQILLRNPLADPFILGVSGGAAVGALSALLAGLGTAAMTGSAFGGALVSILIVFALAHGRGSWA